MSTIDRLTDALAALSPIKLNIEDDSALHAGHSGNTGGGHYTIRIVSKQFEGLALLKRHRLVHDAVRPLLEKEIHALSIQAKTPTEINL